MLYLYDKNTRDFTRNGTPLRDAYDAHVVREEGFYLKFKMLLNGQHKQLKKEMVVSAMTPSGYNQFRIFDINPQTDHVEVVALHLFYYLDNRLVRPFTLKDGSGVSAIRMFAANFVSDISPYTFDSSVDEKHDFQASTTETTDRDYLNALEVINRIGVRWDSEFELNGFDVRMIKRLGRRTNALLYEKKNIADFEEETTIRNLVTRIHAVSRWTLNNDDEGYVQDGDNDRELKVVVDSPLINEYSQIYEAKYVHNTARTEEELINWANLKYSTDNLDKPRRSIKVKANIIDGTEINLGDELVLKYLIHDVDEVIRCVGYDYDPIGKSYYEITLGEWRQSFGNTVGKAVADVTEKQKSQLETIQKNVQIIQMKADGIGRVTYGPNPIPNPQHGDLWYYYTLDRPNEVELRIYDSEIGDWRKGGFDKDAFDKKIAEIDTQTQAMEAAIQANETKANQALEQAGASTNLATEAQRLADEAKQAHASLSQEVSEAKADLVQKGLELSQLTENFGVTERKVEELDGAIKETVTRSDYDALTGRVSQAETIIQSQAGEITQRLTRTEVESLVNQKDYLSASVFNNYKTETAQSLTQRFEEVRGLIPTPEDLTLPFESFKNEYDRTAKHVIDNLSSVIQTDSQWYTTLNNRLRTAEGNFDTLSRTKADLTAFQTVKATTDLYERILGKTEGDVQTNASRLVMSSDLFQVEVGKYINLANNLVYGATKLPKYISSVATTNHIRRVSWGDHDGVGINYTSEMNGWLGVIFPLTKRFVKQGDRLSYRIEISVDTVPSKGGVLIQLIDNTPQSNMMYNSVILINKTGSMVATGYIDIPRTGELAEYSLRFTLTGPGNIIMHRMIIVEGDVIPEKFYDTTDYNSEYTRTNLTMLQDRISLGLFNQAGLVSGVQFGQNGVYIKGSLINLDGTVNINDAFVKKLLVDTASIQTLTAFSARIANLVAVNIDASNITTNMITAIEGAFRSSAGSVSISRNIISINTGSGTNMILNSSGLHYNDSANNLIGWVGRSNQHGSVYGRALNISVAPGKMLALGYAASGGSYSVAMMIDGSTGKASIPNGLFPSVTSSAGIYVTNSPGAVMLTRTDRSSGIIFYDDGRVGIVQNSTIVKIF